MKRLFLIIVLIFLTSSANTVTYNSDPKIFITELVDDALKILSEKSTTVDEKVKGIEKIAIENRMEVFHTLKFLQKYNFALLEENMLLRKKCRPYPDWSHW